MLIDFISTMAAGFAVAGIVLLLIRLTGRRLPKWTLPAAVGLAMIGFSIYREYTWFPEARAQLPAEVIITDVPQDRVFYRPWTYVWPLATRFMAVDRRTRRVSESDPNMIVAPVLLVKRWIGASAVPMAFDCAKNRMATLAEGTELADAGTLTGAEWHDVGADDSVLMAACKGG
jgi:hypothetical protein